MIKTDGKEKDYELIEYVNDVNREHQGCFMNNLQKYTKSKFYRGI